MLSLIAPLNPFNPSHHRITSSTNCSRISTLNMFAVRFFGATTLSVVADALSASTNTAVRRLTVATKAVLQLADQLTPNTVIYHMHPGFFVYILLRLQSIDPVRQQGILLDLCFQEEQSLVKNNLSLIVLLFYLDA